jgi:hypothetical protein
VAYLPQIAAPVTFESQIVTPRTPALALIATITVLIVIVFAAAAAAIILAVSASDGPTLGNGSTTVTVVTSGR